MTAPCPVALYIFDDVSQLWNRARSIPDDFVSLVAQGRIAVLPFEGALIVGLLVLDPEENSHAYPAFHGDVTLHHKDVVGPL